MRELACEQLTTERLMKQVLTLSGSSMSARAHTRPTNLIRKINACEHGCREVFFWLLWYNWVANEVACEGRNLF